MTKLLWRNMAGDCDGRVQVNRRSNFDGGCVDVLRSRVFKWIAVAGVSLLVGLSGGVALAATSSMTSIQVAFENIGIDVNGQAESSGAQPFIYNGHVYLPIRYVAQDLNTPVSWDSSSHTVYVGNQPAGQSTDLSALQASLSVNCGAGCQDFLSTGYTTLQPANEPVFSINGTSYSNGLMLGSSAAGSATETWNLNGKYISLAASIGLDDASSHAATVTFSGDGNTLASYTLTPGGAPQSVALNLTGAQTLVMTVTTTNATGTQVDLVNPVLH